MDIVSLNYHYKKMLGTLSNIFISFRKVKIVDKVTVTLGSRSRLWTMLFSACGHVLSLNTLYKHYKKRWGCTVKKKKKKKKL